MPILLLIIMYLEERWEFRQNSCGGGRMGTNGRRDAPHTNKQ